MWSIAAPHELPEFAGPAGGEPHCFNKHNIIGRPEQYIPFDVEDEQLGLMWPGGTSVSRQMRPEGPMKFDPAALTQDLAASKYARADWTGRENCASRLNINSAPITNVRL